MGLLTPPRKITGSLRSTKRHSTTRGVSIFMCSLFNFWWKSGVIFCADMSDTCAVHGYGRFQALATQIAKLAAGGVETFLSMGGWNYNCFPAMYATHPPPHTPKPSVGKNRQCCAAAHRPPRRPACRWCPRDHHPGKVCDKYALRTPCSCGRTYPLYFVDAYDMRSNTLSLSFLFFFYLSIL